MPGHPSAESDLFCTKHRGQAVTLLGQQDAISIDEELMATPGRRHDLMIWNKSGDLDLVKKMLIWAMILEVADLVGDLEHVFFPIFPIIYGMSSFPLTNMFSEG